MHWVGAQEGMLDAERELILSEQTPADVVFLSAADTDLTAVAAHWSDRFGTRLRLSHAAPLRQPVAADYFVEKVLRGSQLLIARLLGGRAYFPHLFQALLDLKECHPRPRLLLLSPTEAADSELAALSDFPGTRPRFCTLFLRRAARATSSRQERWQNRFWHGTAPRGSSFPR